jgi:hypothetical protein
MTITLKLISTTLVLTITTLISSAPAQTKFKPTEVRTTLFPYNQEWGRLQNLLLEHKPLEARFVMMQW